MNESDNSEKKQKKDKWWLFQPGQSGNPAGRPKGSKSLKTFAKEFLMSLSDEEKLEFMRQVDPDIVWKMAENNPAQDITSGGEKLPAPIYGGVSIPGHNSNKEDISA